MLNVYGMRILSEEDLMQTGNVCIILYYVVRATCKQAEKVTMKILDNFIVLGANCNFIDAFYGIP
jgi:hypothetical protein